MVEPWYHWLDRVMPSIKEGRDPIRWERGFLKGHRVAVSLDPSLSFCEDVHSKIAASTY